MGNAALESGGKESGKRTQWIRWGILLGVLAFISWMGYRHQVLGGGPAGSPSVDSMCPFGGLESLYAFLKKGQFLRRIAPSSLILWGGVVLMTLWGGRIFCGWLCPLGTLGELAGRLGRRLKLAREMPVALDRVLRLLKYVVLAVVLYGTWTLGTLVFREYDPWMSWMHLAAGWAELGTGAVILALTLVASLFFERFWCRYLCPLGAALAILGALSPIKLRRESSTCISCAHCSRSCPMGLKPDEKEKIGGAECIRCGVCVSACPVSGALNFTLRKIISPLKMAFIGVLIFVLCLGGARYYGVWRTLPLPQEVQTSGNPVESIFGWMNLRQAAETIHMPLADFLKAAELPEGTPLDVSIKKIPGVSDEELKAKVARWLADKKNGAEKKAPMNPDELRGSVSLNEIASLYSIEAERLLAALNLPKGTPLDKPVKDVMKGLGREVQEVRDAVKKLISEPHP